MKIPLDNENDCIDGLNQFYSTADELFAHIVESNTIACESGCSFCCHLHVTLKPYELLPLVRYVEKLSGDERAALDSKIALNRELLAESSDENLLAVNFTCPFLVDGSCAIYEWRPLSCRVAHSCSKLVCEQAYRAPESGVEADHVPQLTESMRALEDEFEELVGEYYDVSDYNMNEALFEALSDSDWITRFLDGEEVFSDQALSRI